MFSNDEIPQTEFQKQAVSVHPIKQFMMQWAYDRRINGEHYITCEDIWLEYKDWARSSNVSLGTMNEFQFGVSLFAISDHLTLTLLSRHLKEGI